MTDYDVNYEPIVSFVPLVNPDAEELRGLELFQFHSLEKLLSARPAFLLEGQVTNFFKNLWKDADSDVVSTVVSATSAAGAPIQLNINVRSEIHSLFQIPHIGPSPYSIKVPVVATAMGAAVSKGKTSGTLNSSYFKPKEKFVLKAIKHSLLGMLGSFHQVSGPQQKLLTALPIDNQWNWEEVFISSLMDIAKVTKLRLGTKVSAIIIHAAQG